MWSNVSIDQVCKIRNGFAFKSKNYTQTGHRVIRITNVQRGTIEDSNPQFHPKLNFNEHEKYALKEGDILISLTGNVGRVGMLDKNLLPAYLNQRVCHMAIIDKSNLALKFFFWFLNRTSFEQDCIKNSTGVAQKNLSPNWIKKQKISLPPLAEQKRIASILDAAEELRQKRQRSLELLDELKQSIFIDMFGDVASNNLGWDDSITLGALAEIKSGITKGRKAKTSKMVEVPYMAVSNVQAMRLNLDKVKTILVTEEELDRYQLQVNDLLLTEGGDPDKLGRGCLWNNEVPNSIHQNHIFRVRFYEEQIAPFFGSWLIGSQRGKRYFLKAAKQTTGIASINLTQLRAFPMLIPPMKLQIQFENRIKDIDQTVIDVSKSQIKIDELFTSLQHKAFAGELLGTAA